MKPVAAAPLCSGCEMLHVCALAMRINKVHDLACETGAAQGSGQARASTAHS
jgi:hypothetical protein